MSLPVLQVDALLGFKPISPPYSLLQQLDLFHNIFTFSRKKENQPTDPPSVEPTLSPSLHMLLADLFALRIPSVPLRSCSSSPLSPSLSLSPTPRRRNEDDDPSHASEAGERLRFKKVSGRRPETGASTSTTRRAGRPADGRVGAETAVTARQAGGGVSIACKEDRGAGHRGMLGFGGVTKAVEQSPLPVHLFF